MNKYAKFAITATTMIMVFGIALFGFAHFLHIHQGAPYQQTLIVSSQITLVTLLGIAAFQFVSHMLEGATMNSRTKQIVWVVSVLTISLTVTALLKSMNDVNVTGMEISEVYLKNLIWLLTSSAGIPFFIIALPFLYYMSCEFFKQ